MERISEGLLFNKLSSSFQLSNQNYEKYADEIENINQNNWSNNFAPQNKFPRSTGPPNFISEELHYQEEQQLEEVDYNEKQENINGDDSNFQNQENVETANFQQDANTKFE
ncbi:hypothetical protein TSAR_000976 [Trichomalopsis sarcophagae]|uniref:Uncharacterized protein n=1 Tax=Trichomalopsis sarcophagae TaxID=543379 RepID=A0A232EE33_9HYME|nr:hypothetical protein TSAR_000976 [Trichomalopsis sarcophagae]